MTWLWHISSNRSGAAFIAGVLLALAGTTTHAAVVTGEVHLTDSRETAVRRNKDYSGVVVWLEPLNAGARLEPRRAEMVQKEKHFIPHVLAITVGSTVEFPNFDPIFHNAFSNFAGMPFDVGLYPPGTSKVVTFKRDGIVRVFCNIHPTMSAVIVVLRTPYFAVSKPSGAFEIENVPAGEYRVNVFHERATPARLEALHRRITVGAAPLALPPLAISEIGYLAVPHKNKYGEDYPPALDDRAYPGARK